MVEYSALWQSGGMTRELRVLFNRSELLKKVSSNNKSKAKYTFQSLLVAFTLCDDDTSNWFQEYVRVGGQLPSMHDYYPTMSGTDFDKLRERAPTDSLPDTIGRPSWTPAAEGIFKRAVELRDSIRKSSESPLDVRHILGAYIYYRELDTTHKNRLKTWGFDQSNWSIEFLNYIALHLASELDGWRNAHIAIFGIPPVEPLQISYQQRIEEAIKLFHGEWPERSEQRVKEKFDSDQEFENFRNSYLIGPFPGKDGKQYYRLKNPESEVVLPPIKASIRFRLSPSVQASLSEFDAKEVSASALVNSILKRHPEYANGKAQGIHLEEENSKYLRPSEEWVTDVSSLYDYKKVQELHGRLFVVGLSILDKDVEKGLSLEGFLGILEDEIKEQPFDALLSPKGLRIKTVGETDADAVGTVGETDADAVGTVGETDAVGTVGETDADAVGTVGETDADAVGTVGETDADAVGTVGETDAVGTVGDYPTNKDQLGRRIFAEALVKRLVKIREKPEDAQDPPNEAFLLHIHGAWGSGKSSLLKMMQDELNKQDKAKPNIVIDFNAWQQQRTGPPWWSLMNTIFERSVQQIRTKNGRWRAAKLVILETFWRLKVGHSLFLWLPAAIFGVIGLVALFAFPSAITVTTHTPSPFDTFFAFFGTKFGGIISLIVSLLSIVQAFRSSLFPGSERAARDFIELKSDPMTILSTHFKELVKQIGGPITIFIDDLDRCKDTYTVEFLEGIQTMFRGANVSYVIAADRRWLYTCYENIYDTFKCALKQPGIPFGYLFLSKIFQLSVSIPRISSTYQEDYLDRLLSINPSTTEDERRRARENARHRVAALRTEDEILAKISTSNGDPLNDQALREAAVERLSKPEVEAHTEHMLKPFAHLMEPNPRAIKRLLNGYSIARDINLLGYRDTRTRNILKEKPGLRPAIIQPKKLALWTILTFRWPSLAEYIEQHPETISHILGEQKNLDDIKVPDDLLGLFSDQNVRNVVTGGGVAPKLDVRTISELAGLTSDPSATTVA